MDNTSRGYLLGAGLFLLTSLFVLLNLEAEWWSILTVVMTFAASAAFLIRFVVERRRERAADPVAVQPED